MPRGQSEPPSGVRSIPASLMHLKAPKNDEGGGVENLSVAVDGLALTESCPIAPVDPNAQGSIKRAHLVHELLDLVVE